MFDRKFKEDIGILKVDVGELRTNARILKADIGGLREDVREIKEGIRHINTRLDTFMTALLDIRRDLQYHISDDH